MVRTRPEAYFFLFLPFLFYPHYSLSVSLSLLLFPFLFPLLSPLSTYPPLSPLFSFPSAYSFLFPTLPVFFFSFKKVSWCSWLSHHLDVVRVPGSNPGGTILFPPFILIPYSSYFFLFSLCLPLYPFIPTPFSFFIPDPLYSLLSLPFSLTPYFFISLISLLFSLTLVRFCSSAGSSVRLKI